MRSLESYYAQAATELDIPLSTVKKVNNYFWRVGVKESIKNVNNTSIFIKNLGTFSVSKYKLYREIKRVIRFIRGIRISPKYTEQKRQDILKSYYYNLNKLLEKRNQLAKEALEDEYAHRIY